MSSGLTQLHKILKDETRQEILILLEHKSPSYTELMGTLNIFSTGTLNYHLKVLGELLTKNDAGQYMLTEKGALALHLMKLYPTENNIQFRKRRQKWFWIGSGVSQVVYFVVALWLYYYGIANTDVLIQSTVWFFGSLVLVYLGYNMPEPGSEKDRRNQKIIYPVAGGLIGLIVGFFGPVVWSVISVSLGGANFIRDATITEFITCLLVPTTFGAILGYYVGKRSQFRKPKWVTQIDQKFGL